MEVIKLRQQSISLADHNKEKLTKLAKKWGITETAAINHLIAQYGEQAVIDTTGLYEILKLKSEIQTRQK